MASSLRESHYEVLVVGGGPAGAAAAVRVSRAGLRVALLERERYPRDKPCAGGLTERCARVMDDVFGPDVRAGVVTASSVGVRLAYGDRCIAEETELGRIDYVRRTELDHALAAAARAAGCEVVEGVRAVAVSAERGEVTLASGETVRGDVVVAADGVESALRRSLFGPRGRRGMGLGVVVDVPRDELKDAAAFSSRPYIDFAAVEWGYGWVFPKGDAVSIGVGGALGRGTNYRERLRAFVETHCRPGAWERWRPRGARLPAGDFLARPCAGRVLFAGDAAGFVDPITGEGIAYAVESGRLAGRCAAEALAAGRPAAAAYARACRPIVKELRQACLVRWLFFPSFCQRRAMNSLSRHPRLVRLFMELMSGRITYGGYVRRALFSFGE